MFEVYFEHAARVVEEPTAVHNVEVILSDHVCVN
jgi:hypothetical protein